MLSVYMVQVNVYNTISVPGEGYGIQCHQCTWCRLKYTMLSEYLVQVKVYNAMLSVYLMKVKIYNDISVPDEG